MKKKNKVVFAVIIVGLIISLWSLYYPASPPTARDYTPLSSILIFKDQPLIFDVISKAAANARAGGITIFVGVEKWKPTIYFLHRGVEYNLSNICILKHYDGYIIYTDDLTSAKEWALKKIEELDYNITKAQILYEKFRKFHDPPTLWRTFIQYRTSIIFFLFTIILASAIMFYDKNRIIEVDVKHVLMLTVLLFFVWLMMLLMENILTVIAFVPFFIFLAFDIGLIAYRKYGFWACFGVGGMLLTLIHAVIAPPIYLLSFNKFTVAVIFACLLGIGLLIARYSKVRKIAFNSRHLLFIGISAIATVLIYGTLLGETTPYPYLFVEPDNPDRAYYLTMVSTSNDTLTIMRAYPFHYFERLLIIAPSAAWVNPLLANLIVPPAHRVITLFIGMAGVYALARYLGFDEKVAFFAAILRVFVIEAWYPGLHRSMPASFALAYLPTNAMIIYDNPWFSIPLMILYGQSNLATLYFILVPTFASILFKKWRTKIMFFAMAGAVATVLLYKPLLLEISAYIPTIGAYYYNFLGYLGQVASYERYVIFYSIPPLIIFLGFWNQLEELKNGTNKKRTFIIITSIIYFLAAISFKGFMIRSCEPLGTMILPFFSGFLIKHILEKDFESWKLPIVGLLILSLTVSWISPARVYYIGGLDNMEINYIVRKLPKDGYLMSDSASMKIFGLAGYTVGYEVTNTDNSQASYIKRILLGEIPKPRNNLCIIHSGNVFTVKQCPNKEYFVFTLRTFYSIANKYHYFWLVDPTWEWFSQPEVQKVLRSYHFGELFKKYNVVLDELYFVVFRIK